ncbi:asparaginyl-tRNA synthetase [Mycoplasmoides fastidiosum]|uniref:Asparagine--tRNA ligase n=1 Tax=Mycoplasmoides fastidiosum TaxID=92758 RepID=A0ABU0LYG1_9BACT|nr:asparagine--tRNA ligase [Mycoplasmoides fastidiosum]MDQ0513736.1 asparaginyl-tRNA synthetase [Mycoplasmoides fastidiosum]UUD37843.1 asparagine--tRNA ligase [Mycoplasmoides fastidiosum]
MQVIDIKEIEAQKDKLEFIHVVGWAVTNRKSGKVLGFLELNDGSSFNNLQVVYKENETLGFEEATKIELGAAVRVSGNFKKTPNAAQPYELQAKEIVVLASCKNFPIQKKEQTPEFLRTIAHVRHRTKYFQAIQMVRNQLSTAINNFFACLNFVWLHAPIFTGIDCEGAGEAFEIQKMEHNQDFFKKPARLSVSGQLHAEAFALGLKRVYTFGPTFRAEKSFTNRHAAEFWMLEPEVSFATLDDNLELIENLLKHLLNHVLTNCKTELNYLAQANKKPNLVPTLNEVVNKKFTRMNYKDAVVTLKNDSAAGLVTFEENNIHFGMDLKTEHERYLCEKVVKGPVFIFDYPKSLKAFYMKVNDDDITVAAADLLVPGIGELVGGSEREYRYDVLKKRCQELNIELDSMQWYLDLRKYGYYRSAGFGVGFDRLVMYVTGTDNIKDTLPFPRTYQQMNF